MRRPQHHWHPSVGELLAARPELADVGLAPVVSMIGSAA